MVDSFPRFLIFCAGWPRFVLASFIFLPRILLFKLKIIDGSKLKLSFFAKVFSKFSEDELVDAGERFVRNLFEKHLFNCDLLKILEIHRDNGDEVVVVSASFDVWISPFARNLGISFIATNLQYENGIFKGRYNTPNCKGEEKVNRLKEIFQLDAYSILSYGNKDDHAVFKISESYVQI